MVAPKVASASAPPNPDSDPDLSRPADLWLAVNQPVTSVSGAPVSIDAGHPTILFVFLPSLILFILMDIGWIAVVAGEMFKSVLGKTCLMLFWGGTLGLIIYGTYELTNKSVISTWTWSLALSDSVWGSFACACAAATQFKLHAWVADSQGL
eukprot:gene20961-27816_t